MEGVRFLGAILREIWASVEGPKWVRAREVEGGVSALAMLPPEGGLLEVPQQSGILDGRTAA